MKYLLKIAPPILIILISLLLGIVFEKRVLKYFRELAQHKGWKLNQLVLASFRGVAPICFTLLGIFFALPSLPISTTIFDFIQRVLLAIFLAMITLVIARMSVGLLKIYTTQDDGISPLTSLFEFLTKIVIFSLGILIILQSIGIQITPLLTALGVGGVSIGLALQSTLVNLMSGINIITSGKVKPGDFIELKTGEAGYVKDVELKYTIVQEITSNILVIPNAKIIASSFRNYSLTDKAIILPIDLTIDYDSDLEKVELVTLEVVEQVLGYTDIDKYFIRYQKFDYWGIHLTVYLKIKEKEFFEHVRVKHELLKQIHQRYKLEEIKIPSLNQLKYLPSSFVGD